MVLPLPPSPDKKKSKQKESKAILKAHKRMVHAVRFSTVYDNLRSILGRLHAFRGSIPPRTRCWVCSAW